MSVAIDKIKQIDKILPQTQCGQCGYGGCLPYAQAIIQENAPINKCTPGGVETLYALADITKAPLSEDWIHTMREQDALNPGIAVIQAEDCIGCTKCIQACPVDAIIGSVKQLHAVMTDECTGCQKCIPVCPVDCIEMDQTLSLRYDKLRARKRYDAKKERIEKERARKLQQEDLKRRQQFIAEALERVKEKKKNHESL